MEHINPVFRFVLILFIVMAAACPAFTLPAAVPWETYFREILPDGFDPYSGTVVGVSGPTAVTVAHSKLSNGKAIDMYYPPGIKDGAMLPALVLINGNSDTVNRAEMGRPWMQTKQAMGWGRLAAEHGFIGISYDAGGHPADALKLIGDWLNTNASACGIDLARVGTWACSNSGGVAVDAFRAGHAKFSGIKPRFGVFYYSLLPPRSDFDMSTPILVACGDLEGPAILGKTEQFVTKWRGGGGTAEILHNTTCGHGFDVVDSEETRKIIAATFEFIANY